MAEFVMPSLGADMEAGTLVTWLKKPSDTIARGEVIAEVDTDKGLIEVECFTSGVVEKLLVQPGAKVPVGTALAIIQEEGQTAGRAAAVPVAVEPTPVQPVRKAAFARVKISPLARKLAEELGLDPGTLKGTGPGGRITREDVEQAAAAVKPIPALTTPTDPPTPGNTAERATRMRQAIAAAMARSKREIPHYYLSTTLDFSRAQTWLTAANQQRSVAGRLLYGVLLIKAVARALREFPELNGVWQGEQFVPSVAIHTGVAIALRQGGLFAPALHDADKQSLDELMRNFRELVQRTRTGALRSSELTDATITITSLGEQGVETVFGVIYPPQVALVGFGKVVERPWAVNGLLGVRPVLTATLAADHRVSDGHRGGLFLAALDRLLQAPEKL